ncbi:MAG: trxB [Rhodospirillales bacterium]|nr:trxB [Rhodospirillales bacterium]
MLYDVAIVGGGPAGLSAALILARACRRVIVCDASRPRNRHSSELGGFLTRDRSPPGDLRRLGRLELATYDTVEMRENTEVLAVRSEALGFRLQTRDGVELNARKLLIATGVVDELPPITGIEAFYGTSVWHCPYCDGYKHRGQSIAVYGLGKEAVTLALELTGWSSDIIMLTDDRRAISAAQRRRLASNGIKIRDDRVQSLEGANGELREVRFTAAEPLAARALFFPSRGRIGSNLAESLGIQVLHHTVRTAGYGKTGVRGVFVAGDAAHHIQLAIVAAGEGAAAAFAINTELLKEDLVRFR